MSERMAEWPVDHGELLGMRQYMWKCADFLGGEPDSSAASDPLTREDTTPQEDTDNGR